MENKNNDYHYVRERAKKYRDILKNEFPEFSPYTIHLYYRHNQTKSLDEMREDLKRRSRNEYIVNRLKSISKNAGVDYRGAVKKRVYLMFKKGIYDLTDEEIEKVEQFYYNNILPIKIVRETLKEVCKPLGYKYKSVYHACKRYLKIPTLKNISEDQLNKLVYFIQNIYRPETVKEPKKSFIIRRTYDKFEFGYTTLGAFKRSIDNKISLTTLIDYYDHSNTREEFMEKVNKLLEDKKKYPKEKFDEVKEKLHELQTKHHITYNYLRSSIMRELQLTERKLIDDPSLFKLIDDKLIESAKYKTSIRLN